MSIKVAVTTDDGETISRHYGQAKYFNESFHSILYTKHGGDISELTCLII